MVATIIIIIVVAIIAVGATAGTFVVFPQLPQAIGNIAPFIDDLQIDYPTPEEVQQETMDNKEDFMEQLPEFVPPPDLDPMDFETPSEDIPIEEEPNFEEPVTSEDPPITQICDELLLDCGTESVGLLVEITTVDSNGTRTIEEFSEEFQPLAFFGSVESGKELSKGSLELRMWIQGEPDIPFAGNGFLNILTNNNTITAGITSITTSGITDQNGMLDIEFALSTGQRTNVFIFSFEENSDLFPLNSKTILSAEVNDFIVKKNIRDEFSIVSTEIFTTEIVNSADAITFIELDGTTGVAYPTDSSLKIFRDTAIGRAPKVAMGMIAVTDSNGNIVATAPSSTAQLCGLAIAPTHRCPNGFGASEALIDVLLARDTTYNIKIGEPTPFNFDISIPLSQKNYEFACRLNWEDPVVNTLSPYKITSLASLWTPILYRSINILDIPIICNMPLDAVNGTSFPAPNSVSN